MTPPLPSTTNSTLPNPKCGITNNSSGYSKRERRRRRRKRRRMMRGELAQFLFTQITERCKMGLALFPWLPRFLESQRVNFQMSTVVYILVCFQQFNFQIMLSFPKSSLVTLWYIHDKRFLSATSSSQLCNNPKPWLLPNNPGFVKFNFTCYINLHLQSSMRQWIWNIFLYLFIEEQAASSCICQFGDKFKASWFSSVWWPVHVGTSSFLSAGTC